MAAILQFLLVLFVLCVNQTAAANKLIVVLIDGCKWDYPDISKLELRGMKKIAEDGVRAPYVNPVYPSLSYPNWYSIVTGLYPESHGFVNNIMYDNGTGTSFLMLPHEGSTDPHWWNQAEPIWVTAEKRGKNSALYWWAGCEVKIKGVQPMICERHRYGPGTEEEKLDFLERIDDVIQLFKPPDMERLSLALMYYGPVDYNGHNSGPGAPETLRAFKDIDEILYKMLYKIEKAGLKNEVNVMVVSDHGTTDVRESTTKYIDLEKFAPSIKFQVSSGATSMLVPVDGALDKLYQDLKDAKIKGIKVFKKGEIPESYHLNKSPLINGIFLQAEKGHFITALRDQSKRIGDLPQTYKGHHGYHPDDVTDMRTIFFATGPDFHKGQVLPPITNVDLYNVMCHILRLDPLPNNGSSELLKDILSGENTSHLKSKSVCVSQDILCFILSCFVLVLFFI